MSSRLSSPALSGQATVTLRNGTVFCGRTVYDRHGRVVTIEDGRLRVSCLIDGELAHTYRPPRRRTLPAHLIREIQWRADA